MKKITISFALMQFMSISLHAQTHYGTSAGTLGQYHSYFGYFAGNAADNISTENSFFGNSSGRSTTTGYSNTGLGYSSLRANNTGYSNTAVGSSSLKLNTTGHGNTAIGFEALRENTYGSSNTAIGEGSLKWNIGQDNTAAGNNALNNTTTGNGNVAFGNFTLSGNKEGSYNSAFGSHSITGNPLLCQGSYNSAFGSYTKAATCSGYTNFTVLGYFAQATASNQVRIGNADVTSIGGQVSWTTLSDGRFKKNLKRDVAGLDFINQLNPVSYTVDKDALNKFLDVPDSMRVPTTEAERNARQVGFVAQEVEAVIKSAGYVFTGIEAPKNENDTYSIRYAEFVVPLVMAVQELTAKVDAQEKKITTLTEALRQYAPDMSLDEKGATSATLFQNNPNPFSSTTEIHMKVPEATRNAIILVYNLEGKQLKDFQVNERGAATIKISGGEFSAGTDSL
jgi:trimeric autotransporter adhesin